MCVWGGVLFIINPPSPKKWIRRKERNSNLNGVRNESIYQGVKKKKKIRQILALACKETPDDRQGATYWLVASMLCPVALPSGRGSRRWSFARHLVTGGLGVLPTENSSRDWTERLTSVWCTALRVLSTCVDGRICSFLVTTHSHKLLGSFYLSSITAIIWKASSFLLF